MKTILRCAFAAMVVALCAQPAAAQPMTGCPPGQVMQSSSPSGKQVTCVALPDVSGLTETDIIGNWAVTGSTSCLQSSRGFNDSFSPIIDGTATTTVSQLTGSFLGIRTFYAGGTGRSVGTTHSTTMPGTNYGAFPGPGPSGGASVTTLDANFTWEVQSDGRLLIDDDNSIPQHFTAPDSLTSSTVTAKNVPKYLGYISKDKRMILMAHATLSVETSELHDATGAVTRTTPRFCSRARVLTRLP